MKKILIISLFFITLLSFAQVPQGISYQAIALNSAGSPVVSANVGLRLSVLDNSATGTSVYSETHTKTTNAQGLFNLVIGQGTIVSGTFNTINWGTNSKFLKVEMDAAGGTNYVLVGTTQLLSAPYALYAEKINYSNLPQTIKAKSKTSQMIVIYTPTNVYGFYQNNGASGYWTSQTINGTPIGAIASDKNIVIYTTTNAYAFYQNSGNSGYWTSQVLNGTPIGAVASNTNIVVYTTNNAYGFYQNTGATGYWSSQTLNGTPIGAVASNDNAVVYTSSNAYGFYQNNEASGYWSSQTLNGTPIDAVASKNNILVYTNTDAYGFYQNTGSSGYWTSQTLNGSPIEAISK
jgi:hypothetical protein